MADSRSDDDSDPLRSLAAPPPGRPTRAVPAVPAAPRPASDDDDDHSSQPDPAVARTTASLAALDMVSLPAAGKKQMAQQRPPIPTSSLLHPTLSTLPMHNAANADVLTPLRAHYLKKYLVNHQFMDELATLADPALTGGGANAAGDAIAALGRPFVAGRDPQTGRERALPDLPFIRFMFRQFVLTFPFLSSAPPSFWPHKVQPTLSQFLALSLAPSSIPGLSDDPSVQADAVRRRRLFDQLEKHMTLLLGSALKLTSGEEVVRITQADLAQLEREAQAKFQRERPALDAEAGEFEINVVGVRAAPKGPGKGSRSKEHEEFLVRTRRKGREDVFVWRRYGDFKRLAEELRARHPDEEIRPLPAKDKSASAMPSSSSSAYGDSTSSSADGAASGGYASAQPQPAAQTTRAYLASWIPGASSPLRTATPTVNHQSGGDNIASASYSTPPGIAATAAPLPPLTREKNRLTLRSFLRSFLVSSGPIASSPILRSFLLSGPQTLSTAELADARRREDADRVREEGRKRFRAEAGKRVEELRESVKELREEIVQSKGIRKVFEVLAQVDKVKDLPDEYRKVLEYGKISLAAAIFQTFVASDDASSTFGQLKRLHGLMPYFVLKGILRISNPMAMIRGVLELFLARPFGGQSLIQRMFSTTINEEIRELQEQVDHLAHRIGDPAFCEKVRAFVAAPSEVQALFKRDAEQEGIDLLAVILRSPDAPALGRPQMLRVIRAHRAYAAYRKQRDELDDSDDDDGPEIDQEDAWLFVDLGQLMRLYSRMQEKERMIALIFEGATAELMKDIITIFYAPLAQVYKAASIADSLGDLQTFINDLIRTVDDVEELSQEDPGRTVQTFIDLVDRHEQAFYSFVHKVHSKGSDLFASLMAWIEVFLDFIRDGLPPAASGGPTRIDLEILLPHSGPERLAMLREVDAIAVYHYKLKVAHESKVRRKFLRTTVRGAEAEGLDAEDEQALIDSVVDGLDLGGTIGGGVAEIGAEDDDDDDDEYDEDERGRRPFDTPADGETGFSWAAEEREHREAEAAAAKAAGSNHRFHLPGRGGKKRRDSAASKGSPSSSRASSPDRSGQQQQQERPPLPPADGLYVKREAQRHAKTRGKAAIAPPVIRLLPTVLPLFVEMVRPLLIEAQLDAQIRPVAL